MADAGSGPAGSLLPPVTGLADYGPLFDQTEIWLPAMAEICQQQGLPADRLERIGEGSAIVFACGEALIKLLPPFWRRERDLDLLGLQKSLGRLPVTTPELLGTGEIQDWSYLITRRMAGVPLKGLWRQLVPAQQAEVMRQLGELMQSLQELDIAGLPGDWPAFVTAQTLGFASTQQAKGLSAHQAEAFALALTQALPTLSETGQNVFLHSDLTDEHVLMTEVAGAWRITGLIDFGDAMAGEALYELAAPCTLLSGGRPELRQALLRGFGREVNEDQLLAVQLLHRFCFLKALLNKSGPTVADFRRCFCRI